MLVAKQPHHVADLDTGCDSFNHHPQRGGLTAHPPRMPGSMAKRNNLNCSCTRFLDISRSPVLPI